MFTIEQQQAIDTYFVRTEKVSCRGCQRVFGVRGLKAHQSAKFITLACKAR